MKVMLYRDSTISIDLDLIIDNLNRLAPTIHFTKGKAVFKKLDPPVITYDSYKQLSKTIDRETNDSDAVLLFTELPYENNYF